MHADVCHGNGQICVMYGDALACAGEYGWMHGDVSVWVCVWNVNVRVLHQFMRVKCVYVREM